MTTYNIYNTYQEAKIENKDSEILKARDDWQGREELIGKFIANKPDKIGGIPCVGEGCFEICNPADYCISVSELHEKGLELVHGDLYELEGNTHEFGVPFAIDNNLPKLTNEKRYVLRAKAIEQPNQTEWDGEGLPPVGVECEMTFNGKGKIITPLYYDDNKSGMVLFYHIESNSVIAREYDWCLVENVIFRKPETPEQKDERERLEAAYDLYCDYCKGVSFNAVDFEHFGKSLDCKDTWTAIVDKTNYRKGGEQ